MSTYILEMRNKLKGMKKAIGLAQRMHIPLDILHFIEKEAPDLIDRYESLEEANKELMVENARLSK